jgi:hypothetical protein
MKDIFSREIKKVVDMIGLDSFPVAKFKSNNELAKFIEEIASLNETFLEANQIKKTKKIVDNSRFFVNLAHSIR